MLSDELAWSLRRRSLAAAGLDGPPVARYKADARSAVWAVALGNGSDAASEADWWVIKQFTYSPLRQQLGLRLGLHPAQRERRGSALLARAGIPAVSVAAGGYRPAGTGGVVVWLATPWAGRPLHAVLRDSTLAPDDHRAAIDAAAGLTRRLIETGLWFRDLKPSNVILDETGRARLIDTGSVERARRRARVERMTATMQRVLSRQHIDPRLIERYRQMVAPTGR